MAACAIKPGEYALQVGAGSGYFTAILAELVGETGHVIAFEIDEALAERARRNLSAWPWAKLGSQPRDTKSQSVDVVYVCAGVEQIPLSWFFALRPGGRLLVPLVPQGGEGAILLVRNIGLQTTFSARFICSARFVPCIGALDDELRQRLVQAFQSETSDSVHSLRLEPERPDATAWISGRGWWLSTSTATAAATGALTPA
jgi:protein-L-isoaspartate(D-aspartate) O-methyltransferase